MADPRDGASPAGGNLISGYRPYLLLSLLVFAVYAQTIAFGLTNLDDTVFLKDRFHLLNDWSRLPLIFTRGALLSDTLQDAYYRPLLTLTFVIDAHLGGPSPGWFHFSNLLYHALATGLVFALFRRLGLGDRSLLLAAIFAVHPVLAQSVAWIPGRTDSVLAVFILASFNAFLDHLANPRRRSLLLHLLFLALALLVKELAVVVPALCALRVFLTAPRGSQPFQRWLPLGAGWGILLAGWFGVRHAVLGSGTGYSAAHALSSLAGNLPAAGVYGGKCLLPVGLSPYPILADASWIPVVAAVVALIAAAALTRPLKVRALLWGAAWFGIFLLPSFVYPMDSITPVFFEYRAYLPLIGLLTLLAELRPLRDFTMSGTRRPAWAALILVLAVGSVLNSRHYRDAEAHWERAVAVSPHSAFSHNHLGVARYAAKDSGRAAQEYRAAIALKPTEPGAHNNLGTLLLEAGRLDEAGDEYGLELAAHPANPSALFNLGIIRFRQGKPDEAKTYWERTVAADADFVAAYVNLAAWHVERKNRERASEYAREALRRGAALPPGLAEFLKP